MLTFILGPAGGCWIYNFFCVRVFLSGCNHCNCIETAMDWLMGLFSSKGPAARAEEKDKKRRSKEHSRRVRTREKELRRGAEGNKRRLFWGSPGQTYESNWQGQGEVDRF